LFQFGEGAALAANARCGSPFPFFDVQFRGSAKMGLAQIEALARRLPLFAAAREVTASLLAGGITNTNYRLAVDGNSFVIRIPGENTELLGIERKREMHNHSVAASAGVAPDVIGFIMPEGALVTRFIHGEKISQGEMRTNSKILELCRSLHLVHDGPDFEGSFSPFRAVEDYLSLARAKNAFFPGDIEDLEKIADEIEHSLYDREPLRPGPIHSDLLNENLISEGTVIRILDWEYSGMGDIFFDLGNLADHHDFSDEEERALLERYFGEFRSHDAARLKLMRIMSGFREAMWGIVQKTISRLEFDFSGYSDEFFGRMRRLASNPNYRQWLEDAANDD
jgi:thiamine kinase-like enzyme